MNRVREIVKASYAHGAHIYGAGSCIAILDSGIAPHPDFSGRIIGWHDVLSSTRQPYDDYGHGTHVAGIAAGSGQASRGLYRGIAPRADLVAVKVLNRYGEGTVESICSGIDWVLRNRMRYGINIVNISAGTAKEKQFDESSPLVRKSEESRRTLGCRSGCRGFCRKPRSGSRHDQRSRKQPQSHYGRLLWQRGKFRHRPHHPLHQKARCHHARKPYHQLSSYEHRKSSVYEKKR